MTLHRGAPVKITKDPPNTKNGTRVGQIATYIGPGGAGHYWIKIGKEALCYRKKWFEPVRTEASEVGIEREAR